MKEDKFCLSKSVAFIAVVAFILVGVVVFTNYMNSQKVGGTPKASTGNQTVCEGSVYNGLCVSDASCAELSTRTSGSYQEGPVNSCGGDATLKCCVPKSLPQPTNIPAGSKTCEEQKGQWYNDANCAGVSARTGGLYVTPPVAPYIAPTGLVCCVDGKQPTVDPKANTCTNQGGNWYLTSTFANCNDIGSLYKDVVPVGTVFTDAAYWSGYKCCKADDAPAPTRAPLGSKTCVGFGGNWYGTACDAITGAKYEDVVAPTPGVILDSADWASSFCCKPKTTNPATVCGYLGNESCWPKSPYTDCSKVKDAVGGNWRAANVMRECPDTANQVCCIN